MGPSQRFFFLLKRVGKLVTLSLLYTHLEFKPSKRLSFILRKIYTCCVPNWLSSAVKQHPFYKALTRGLCIGDHCYILQYLLLGVYDHIAIALTRGCMIILLYSTFQGFMIILLYSTYQGFMIILRIRIVLTGAGSDKIIESKKIVLTYFSFI